MYLKTHKLQHWSVLHGLTGVRNPGGHKPVQVAMEEEEVVVGGETGVGDASGNGKRVEQPSAGKENKTPSSSSSRHTSSSILFI